MNPPNLGELKLICKEEWAQIEQQCSNKTINFYCKNIKYFVVIYIYIQKSIAGAKLVLVITASLSNFVFKKTVVFFFFFKGVC